MTDWVKKLNTPYVNVGTFLVLQQVAKFIGIDNPAYLNPLRYLYLGAQLLIFGLNFYIIHVIKTKNDQTVLKYVEPASQGWDGQERAEQLVNITVKDYDIAEVNKQVKQSAIGILMITVLHFKMGYVQPLLMQSVLGFKTFFLTKEARIHLFGSPTNGDLRRPFRLEAPFGMVNEKKQPKTDKGSIKKAERAKKAE